MREEDAHRLFVAVERQRSAARRLVDGTIDERSAGEYAAATWEEAIALNALDAGRVTARSPRPRWRP